MLYPLGSRALSPAGRDLTVDLFELRYDGTLGGSVNLISYAPTIGPSSLGDNTSPATEFFMEEDATLALAATRSFCLHKNLLPCLGARNEHQGQKWQAMYQGRKAYIKQGIVV